MCITLMIMQSKSIIRGELIKRCSGQLLGLGIVRINYEDVEDLDDVYYSIAVTKYVLYLGFNRVGINPEHPKF